MAVVTITIKDKEDGTVNVVLESDPPIPGLNRQDTMTDAQYTGIEMLDAVATPDDIVEAYDEPEPGFGGSL